MVDQVYQEEDVSTHVEDDNPEIHMGDFDEERFEED